MIRHYLPLSLELRDELKVLLPNSFVIALRRRREQYQFLDLNAHKMTEEIALTFGYCPVYLLQLDYVGENASRLYLIGVLEEPFQEIFDNGPKYCRTP